MQYGKGGPIPNQPGRRRDLLSIERAGLSQPFWIGERCDRIHQKIRENEFLRAFSIFIRRLRQRYQHCCGLLFSDFDFPLLLIAQIFCLISDSAQMSYWLCWRDILPESLYLTIAKVVRQMCHSAIDRFHGVFQSHLPLDFFSEYDFSAKGFNKCYGTRQGGALSVSGIFSIMSLGLQKPTRLVARFDPTSGRMLVDSFILGSLIVASTSSCWPWQNTFHSGCSSFA